MFVNFPRQATDTAQQSISHIEDIQYLLCKLTNRMQGIIFSVGIQIIFNISSARQLQLFCFFKQKLT